MEQPVLQLTVKCDLCGTLFDVFLDVGDAMKIAASLPESASAISPICPSCRANRFNERHLYEAQAGDRVRIGIPYGGGWLHAFWLRVSRDGDIYCSFGYGDAYIHEASTGEATSEARQVRVNYADPRRDVVGPLKGGRVSFHASGQINLADLEIVGTPLANRADQEILGVMVFEHPSAFPPIGAIGDRDILLPFEVVEDQALLGVVQFAPSAERVRFEPGIREIGEPLRELLVRFGGVTGSTSGDLTLYVALGRGPRIQAWPPRSYILVSSHDRS